MILQLALAGASVLVLLATLAVAAWCSRMNRSSRGLLRQAELMRDEAIRVRHWIEQEIGPS